MNCCHRNAVIPAWMPESQSPRKMLRSFMFGIVPNRARRGIGRLPSLALDSGIHAGMTSSNYLITSAYYEKLTNSCTHTFQNIALSPWHYLY